MDAAPRERSLPRLEATFLAIFHPVDGPKVLFQMPEDTFSACSTPDMPFARVQRGPMLDFASLSDYVIPKEPLCGHMITCEVRSRSSAHSGCSYKVLGFPVMLQQADKYQRNNFIFNLCFVFDSRAIITAYEPIVRKCGRALRALEEESSFVSKLENLPRLYGIVEQLYEDLNAYCETFIAIPEEAEPFHLAKPGTVQPNLTLVDPKELNALLARASGPHARVTHAELGEAPNLEHSDANVHAHTESSQSHAPHGLGHPVRDAINLKLFPSYPNPRHVNEWDVPVVLLNIRKHASGNWDLTLVKLLPYIDGVNHVQRIAQLADTDLALVKQCIEHLVYYFLATLIDIFQFSNMYAVRPQIANFMEDEQIGRECAIYVTLPNHETLPVAIVWRLYAALQIGRTVQEWAEEMPEWTQCIDIRRFITFGVLKGFLRRLHRYPYLVHPNEDYTAEVESEWPRRNTEVIAPTSALSATMHAGAPSARNAASSWLWFMGETPNASNTPLDVPSGDSAPFMSAFLRGETYARSAARTARGPRRTAPHRPTATAVDVAKIAYDAVGARVSRSGACTRSKCGERDVSVPVPTDLPALLDGMHCDDELCVRFSVSWSELLLMLQWIGSPFAVPEKGRLDAGGERSPISGSWTQRSREGSAFSGYSARARNLGGARPSFYDQAFPPLSTPASTSDPFATRDVPSRVKIIVI
ncbi:Npr2p [Malassezia vespertilionis]|uniref:Npr2p n=1 Tax=Malassezia vespertilionis TaxID=2020962 RepID=A0A2N1JBQ8_9BASI|nr:Npr2p [Malassezia vespertilionis]